MKCEYCGNPIPPNLDSCPSCGAKCEIQRQSEPGNSDSGSGNTDLVDLYIVSLQDPSQKIAAIKEVREVTGWDLARAKNAVEGNLTPVAFSISKTEADALQNRFSAVGLNMTVQPANPALKTLQNSSKPASSTQKSGCLIMFVPLIGAIVWLLA